MAVKLVTQGGKELILNKSFRVRGLPSEREIPSLTIDGRDGEKVHKNMIRTRPKNLMIVGHIYGDDPEQTQQSLDELCGIINDLDEVKLYLDEKDTQHYNVMYQSVEHNFVHGTNRKVADITITFIAYEPYRYSDVHTHYSEFLSLADNHTLVNINNKGNTKTEPIIWIQGAVTNPKLYSYTTGKVVGYNGNLQENHILVLDSRFNSARLIDTDLIDPQYFLDATLIAETDPEIGENVLHLVDKSYLVYGFPINKGVNQIDVSAEQDFELTIYYRERWV